MLGFFLTENTSNPRYLKPGRIPFPLYEFSRDASGLAVRHGLYSVRPVPNVGPPPNPLPSSTSFCWSWAASNIDRHVRVLA